MHRFGLINFSLPCGKVSCTSPGDTALKVQLALQKQLLCLCSAPGLTLCILSGFSINKTFSPEILSSKRAVGFPHFDSPLPKAPGSGRADQRQRPPSLPPKISLGKGAPLCHLRSGTSSSMALAGCDRWHYSSSSFPDSPIQIALPSFPCLLVFAAEVVLCYAASQLPFCGE